MKRLATTAPPHIGGSPLRLLRRVGRVDPTSLDAYRGDGGYEGLRAALEMGPQGVIAEITASNLLGRGGAAFPTGRKMDAVARAPVRAALSRLQCRRIGAWNV